VGVQFHVRQRSGRWFVVGWWALPRSLLTPVLCGRVIDAAHIQTAPVLESFIPDDEMKDWHVLIHSYDHTNPHNNKRVRFSFHHHHHHHHRHCHYPIIIFTSTTEPRPHSHSRQLREKIKNQEVPDVLRSLLWQALTGSAQAKKASPYSYAVHVALILAPSPK